MEFNQEVPTAPPPSQKRNYPWAHRVDYKSGKVIQAFAEKATPEDVKAGFSYYDTESKTNIPMTAFRAIVVASLSGVSGTTKDAGGKYLNYWSNLVNDTRTEAISVMMQGVDRAIYTGIYQDIKDQFPQGVSYTQVLICYIPEAKEYMSINLTVGLGNHLRRAIERATNAKVKNLFGLCDLTTQYWGFVFEGGFSKVDKDGKNYSGSGDMYFMPNCTAFVLNAKPENVDQFTFLGEGSAGVSDYVKAEQDRIWGASKKPVKDAAPPVSDSAEFPTIDVSSNPEDIAW